MNHLAAASGPVIRRLAPEDVAQAAAIYVEGLLEEEVRPLMPRHLVKAKAVFAELIESCEDVWVAQSRDGVISGLVICRDGNSPTGRMGTWQQLRRHLSRAESIRPWIVARFLYRVSVAPDEIYLQSLVVSEAYRRRGIGEALIRTVFKEAQRRRRRLVSLYVVTGNEPASRLYSRVGFRTVHCVSTGVYRRLVGFSSMERRVKDVSAPPVR